MENKKSEIILQECLACRAAVHELDHNTYGCDSCKSIWKYDGTSWKNISEVKADPLAFLPILIPETTTE